MQSPQPGYSNMHVKGGLLRARMLFVVLNHGADVWARADEFLLDVSVGVPPDAWSEAEFRRRDAEVTPARTIVPMIFVRVLSAQLHGQVRDDLSVREFLFGVASLGGHLGRKGDGPPGWLTLWRGWNDLQLMVQGALALRGAG